VCQVVGCQTRAFVHDLVSRGLTRRSASRQHQWAGPMLSTAAGAVVEDPAAGERPDAAGVAAGAGGAAGGSRESSLHSRGRTASPRARSSIRGPRRSTQAATTSTITRNQQTGILRTRPTNWQWLVCSPSLRTVCHCTNPACFGSTPAGFHPAWSWSAHAISGANSRD
jgi:hypothetical protein